jgi:quinol monooxygenase YgiN
MILVIIRMKVLSEKRLELSQTIASLSGSIRMEKGCQRCDFCQSVEDENRLFLLEEWNTEKNLMTHLKSEHFKVLRGAMNLLKEPCEIMFHTVFHPAGTGEKIVGKVQEKIGQIKKVLGE